MSVSVSHFQKVFSSLSVEKSMSRDIIIALIYFVYQILTVYISGNHILQYD